MKANLAPIYVFQTNSSYLTFDIKTTGWLDYDRLRILDAVTIIYFTLHHHFGPCALELDLAEEFSFLLTDG